MQATIIGGLKTRDICGFSLIHLLITIAVITILSTLAIPVYKNYLIKNNMHIAATIALKNVQYLQKWLAICGSYARDINSQDKVACFSSASSNQNVAWPDLPYTLAPQSDMALYKIKFTSAKPSVTAGNSYRDFNSFRLIATPICNTIQANSGCICIDQDSNVVENANANCSNAGGLCSCTD